MRRVFVYALALLWPLAANAGDIATVNGQAITEKQVLVANPAAKDNPAITHQTTETLINRALLLHAAQDEGLEHTTAFHHDLAAARENLLIALAIDKYLQSHPITAKEIESRYQEMVKTIPKKQFRLREIIVPSYGEGSSILHALKTGHSFSQLAAEKSQGPNAALGGELGWLSQTQIPAPLLQRVLSCKTGEVVGPIAVPNGFAIIQCLGTKHTQVLPLSAVRSQIETELRNARSAAYLRKLQAKAVIHWKKTDTTSSGAS